ncbi:Alpha/Beta hydrolase protein [Cyathus striatus]|nr:Alpha/Beta hydrolase protein [Cyathus striatus]
MPLTKETLYPLSSSSVELIYCYDRSLKYIATRYTFPSNAVQPSARPAFTLIFIGGISLNQETWVPVIKSLYRLTSHQTNTFFIQSAWTIERPNHGDASVLNGQTLNEHYSTSFPACQYAEAIRAFLASDCLTQQERSNLVAVGHSGGGGSMIQSLDLIPTELPIKRLILLESPHCGPPAQPYFVALHKAVRTSNKRRQRSWSTMDEAMNWTKTHLPWKNFHPDVLQIISETYFRPDPSDPSRIITKTLPEQETASFKDDGKTLNALPQLRSILHLLPTHLIVGTIHDIWPKPLYHQIDENIEADRKQLASVTIIDGAGHYFPVQMPGRTAYEIYCILLEALKWPSKL